MSVYRKNALWLYLTFFSLHFFRLCILFFYAIFDMAFELLICVISKLFAVKMYF